MSPASRYDEAWRQRVMGETRAQVAAVEGRRKPVDSLPLLPTAATVNKWSDASSSTATAVRSTGSKLQELASQSSILQSNGRSRSKHSSQQKLSSAIDSQPSTTTKKSLTKENISEKRSSVVSSSMLCSTVSSTSMVTTANSTIESRLLHLEDQLLQEKKGRRAVQQELDQIKRLMSEKFHMRPSRAVKKTQAV